MIFPYHRVLDEQDPLLPGTPSSERFERQLTQIRKYCNPVSLAEGIERLSKGTLPARAVAITFDDGYANNLTIAAPLLKQYEVPATVFVAVHAVQHGIMWNDLLIEGVRAAIGQVDASPLGLGRIEVDVTNRLEIVRKLISTALYLPTRDRFERAKAVYEHNSSLPPVRQMLESSELRQLSAYGVEIGAHTVHHPILRSLPDADARVEIAESSRWLGDVTGSRPSVFAYPNGKPGMDYDDRHVRMVQSLGFKGAVSAVWGCASRRSSQFELPRFKPWEESDNGFLMRLCKTVASTYRHSRA